MIFIAKHDRRSGETIQTDNSQKVISAEQCDSTSKPEMKQLVQVHQSA
jgi:hypothetical protein